MKNQPPGQKVANFPIKALDNGQKDVIIQQCPEQDSMQINPSFEFSWQL